MNDATKPTKIFCDDAAADAGAPGLDTQGVDTPHRFALMMDGRQAGFIEYSLYGRTAIVTHTEIRSEYGGRGLGTELASQAVRFFTARGWQVVPVCGFFARHLRTHPEHAAAATPASRRIFDL
jgi:predicted GNAT family acetyltransferase